MSPETTSAWLIAAGSYGSGEADELTIHLLACDPKSGELNIHSGIGGIKNASYLAWHPNRRYLYAVSETGRRREIPGSLAAFRLQDHKLTLLNEVSSHGGVPCYIAVHPSGRWVIAANYSGGSAVVAPIRDDGTLGEATDVQEFAGSGTHPKRQTRPHAHSAVFDHTGTHAFVQDLGTDRLHQFRFDADLGKLIPNTPPFASAPAGAGPRHLVLHPKLPVAYVVNELSNSVSTYAYDRAPGTLDHLDTQSSLASDSDQTSYGADIHLSPTGEFVYASNRGPDDLALFHVQAPDGALQPAGHYPSGGDWPRGFVLSPDGRFLISANQKSDNIVVYQVDPETGVLTPTGHDLTLPQPVCLTFTP